jgi:hypothetical protein
MINSDAKLLALKALKAKLRKLILEKEGGMDEAEGEMMDGDLSNMERGENNMAEDAREQAEVEQAVDGEDGEKKVSVEIEAEGDSAGMEDLYKRMAEEFGGMPESRKAAGQKKGLMAGGNSVSEVLKGKKKR